MTAVDVHVGLIKATRDALIARGWTPPEGGDMQIVCVFPSCHEDHEGKPFEAVMHSLHHLAAEVAEVKGGQSAISTQLGELMTASEDLKAAVTAEDVTVEGAIGAIVTYLQDIAGKVTGGLSDEDAAALAADINEHAANLSAATANLVAVDPGAPVTTDPGTGDGNTTPPVDTTPVDTTGDGSANAGV